MKIAHVNFLLLMLVLSSVVSLRADTVAPEDAQFKSNMTKFFQEAVRKGNVSDVKRFIREGVDVNYQNILSEAKNIAVVQELLKAGADVNQQWGDKRGALFSNIARPEIIEVLIKAGAHINATDDIGYTPLMRALESNYVETAKILIDAGADGNVVARNGNSALLLARTPEVIKLLLAHGANPNVKRDNEIPFFTAAKSFDLEMVDAFIKAGVNVNMRNNNGATALFSVIEAMNRIKGTAQAIQRQAAMDVIKRLIGAGIDTNITTLDGRTVYDLAQDKPEIIALLPMVSMRKPSPSLPISSSEKPVQSTAALPAAATERAIAFSNHSEKLVVVDIPQSAKMFERMQMIPYQDIEPLKIISDLPIFVQTGAGFFSLQKGTNGMALYKHEASMSAEKQWTESQKLVQQVSADKINNLLVIVNPDGSITIASR